MNQPRCRDSVLYFLFEKFVLYCGVAIALVAALAISILCKQTCSMLRISVQRLHRFKNFFIAVCFTVCLTSQNIAHSVVQGGHTLVTFILECTYSVTPERRRVPGAVPGDLLPPARWWTCSPVSLCTRPAPGDPTSLAQRCLS